MFVCLFSESEREKLFFSLSAFLGDTRAELERPKTSVGRSGDESARRVFVLVRVRNSRERERERELND